VTRLTRWLDRCLWRENGSCDEETEKPAAPDLPETPAPPALPRDGSRRTRMNPGRDALGEFPSRYIAKISLLTGKEILRPIDPDDLLVHAHRDKN